MQIKPIMIYSYTLIRIVKIKKTDHTKCGQESKGAGTLIYCRWSVKWYNHCFHCGKVWQFLKKLKSHLPNTTLLGVCTREIKPCVQAYPVLHRVCSNPVLRKPMGAVFQTAFA